MLFSLDDYKARFRITGTAQDAQIASLRTIASAACERACGRVFEDTGSDVTEYHDGEGIPYICVRRPPITAITAIYIDPARAFGTNTLLAATDYYIVDAGNPLHTGTIELSPGWSASLFTEQPTFGCGRQSVKIIYRGGFQSIPADLREAAMLWAFHMQSHAPGVTSETIGSYSVTYEQSSRGAIPREVSQLLQPFMRKSVGRRM